LRLVTFADAPGKPSRIGVLRGNHDRVVDLAAAGGKLPFDPADMLSLIAAGKPALAAVADLAKNAKADLPLAGLTLLAPIPRPRKNVFCVGWNYVEHFEEGAKARPHVTEMPAHPAFFTKAPTAVNAPYGDIVLDPKVTQKLDWEVELGVIFGPGGKNITEADAMKHVFGYTVVNDVSAREVQRQHGQQWFKGKSIDGSLPMGPWIATADEIDPSDLRVTCRVNGVVKQDSSTKHMYFKIPRLIAELSLGLTLEAGDVFCSGTPAGVGHARTPPEFMQVGDVMETEVGGLGVLRNRIVAP
jgi:2-keto-4-pentenoate hydratase/2-oxohepta-3-ene-1,7-dioic acid hydratase in catechol pathway